MARIPYLVRRGNVFHFRLAVPSSLQSVFECREITQSLFTEYRQVAAPRALSLGARVKSVFNDIYDMTKKDKSIKDVIVEAKHRLELARLEGEKFDREIEHRKEILAAIEKAKLEATIKAQQDIINNRLQLETEPVKAKSTTPKLTKVVDDFLEVKKCDPEKSMLSKHKTALNLFKEALGNKSISELKQSDINDFFAIVQKLPPRWSDQKKKGLSIRKLAEMEHKATIGKVTFENTYKTSIKQFLEDCVVNHQDNGFPVTLTVSGIKYRGKGADKGDKKQRAMERDELKRLFEGAEMQHIANDKKQQGKYWLCHVGLLTGARVNEVCQLNPQCDIIETDGIWIFQFTKESEGDSRISKSIKNKSSCRLVPIHSKLIELGFLDYWKSVKAAGHKLIFPEFKPSKGRAAGSAEKWFRQHLRDIGLRDETRGARLVGFHAFRSTLMNRASKKLRIEDIEAITGHVDATKSAVVRGYEGEDELKELQSIIERIHFNIEFIKPLNL